MFYISIFPAFYEFSANLEPICEKGQNNLKFIISISHHFAVFDRFSLALPKDTMSGGESGAVEVFHAFKVKENTKEGVYKAASDVMLLTIMGHKRNFGHGRH